MTGALTSSTAWRRPRPPPSCPRRRSCSSARSRRPAAASPRAARTAPRAPSAAACAKRRRHRDPADAGSPGADGNGPSPGVTSTCTSWPSAASPSATAVTCTDPPVVPGTVWSMAAVEDPHACRPGAGRASLLLPAARRTAPTDAAEQQQVELHRERRARAARRRSWGCAAMRALAAVRASRTARASASAALTPGSRRRAARLRHRPLGHAHQDVLDEPADDRRVVADPRDAESAASATRSRSGMSASGLR